MDPVTHAVTARMAAAIGRPALTRSAAVLSVVSGLAPDLDAVMMPAGWDRYLRVHEAWTHSVPGGLLLAAVLAGAARRITPEPFRPLFEIAALGVCTHIALDVISGATIKPGWPFTHTRTAWGLVAMADPLLAVPVATALLVAMMGRWRLREVAPVMFAAVGIVLASKGLSRHQAHAAFAPYAGSAALARYVHAEWGSPTRWWIYERTADRVRLWNVDSWHATAVRTLEWDLAGTNDMVPGEQALSTVGNFLLAHELPVRLTARTNEGIRVFWSDLRFCFRPDPGDGPPPGGQLRPTEAAIACGVWFGGELGTDGTVRREFVTIGDFVQAR
jgi:inner membrane protein